MRIALFDFHRKKFYKTDETHKIKTALESHPDAEVDIFEMMAPKVPDVPIGDYAGLVLGGADSNYVERYPGYRIAVNLVAEAMERGMPVLGVCAGHQLIGRLFNWGINFMEDGPEAGWYEIFLTAEGKNDPLLRDIPERFISYQSHIKRVAPDGALDYTILAANNNCPQAYRYRKNVYGIQFHPEETAESGEELIRQYDRRPPTKRHRVTSPDSLEGYRIFYNFIAIAQEVNGT